jgi:hypothetical protein
LEIEERKKEIGKILLTPFGMESLAQFARIYKESPVELCGVLGMTDQVQMGLIYDLLVLQFKRAERILKG